MEKWEEREQRGVGDGKKRARGDQVCVGAAW